MASERATTKLGAGPSDRSRRTSSEQPSVGKHHMPIIDAATLDDETRAALAAVGSCSDLDWSTWVDELDRIRHSVPPTPPLPVQ